MQTILVIDDNVDVCKPLATLIRHLGYNGQYATGGEDGLKFIDGTLPSLVILDVMMPGMDGLEVLRRLKDDERTRGVPVVMFSAVTDPEFRAHAMTKGAVDYWIKAGVDFKELRGRIAQFVPKEIQ